MLRFEISSLIILTDTFIKPNNYYYYFFLILDVKFCCHVSFLLMLSEVPFTILYACVILHISGLIEKNEGGN